MIDLYMLDYSLNSNMMELRFNRLSKSSLIDLTTPIMKKLRDKIKISVHLSVLEGTVLFSPAMFNLLNLLPVMFTSVHVGMRMQQ